MTEITPPLTPIVDPSGCKAPGVVVLPRGSRATPIVPLEMFAALVVSVVAEGAKFTPFVLVQVIAPTLESVQSPDNTLDIHSEDDPIRRLPAVAVVAPSGTPLIAPTVAIAEFGPGCRHIACESGYANEWRIGDAIGDAIACRGE